MLSDFERLKAWRRRWLPFTYPRVLAVLALSFAIWGWFDVQLRATVDPHDVLNHKTDLTVYTEAGAAFFDGRDPYSVTNPRGWGYLYLPLFAMLLAPLSALTTPTQALVWFALSVLMCWGCYVECVRAGNILLGDEPQRGMFGRIPPWLGCVGFAAALLPALNCLQRGQVGVAKLYLLLLGFRLLIESRTRARAFLAGVVLAAPIVLKLTPIVPVGFVLLHQAIAGWKGRAVLTGPSRAGACTLGTAAGLCLFILLLPAALVGWRANLHHLDTWWNKIVVRSEGTFGDDFAGDSYSVRNQSLTNAVQRFGNWAHFRFAGGPHDEGRDMLIDGSRGLLMEAPLVNSILWVARLAAAGLLLVVCIYLGREGDDLGLAAGFGFASVATFVIAPIARSHYYLLFLPATVFMGLWLIRKKRFGLAVAYTVIPALLIIGQYVLMDYVGRIGLLGLGTTAWYVAAGATMIRLSRRALESNLGAASENREAQAGSRPLAA